MLLRMLILMMNSSTKSWVSISNIEKSPQLIFKMRELWSLSNNGQLTQLKFTTDHICCLLSVSIPLSRYRGFKQVPDNLVRGVGLYSSLPVATGGLCGQYFNFPTILNMKNLQSLIDGSASLHKTSHFPTLRRPLLRCPVPDPQTPRILQEVRLFHEQ